MVKHISSGSPFETDFAYARAVVDGEMIYVSGTTGYDYQTMEMPDDVAQQCRNTLDTISQALQDAGSSLRDVLRVRYYLTDAGYMGSIGPVLASYFGETRPAATMVIAELIKAEMKIEIEVTARIGAHGS